MIRYPKPKDFIKSRIHDALLNGEHKLEYNRIREN